jgi:hypothetical protein
VAAAAAVAAGVAAPRPPGPQAAVYPLVKAADVARILSATLAAFASFMADRVERDEGFLRRVLVGRSREQSDIDVVVAEERQRAVMFERLAVERLRRDLPVALAIPEPGARERALRGVLQREERIQWQRSEAMSARAVAAVERASLRRESPGGAFWDLDPDVREHTAGCLVMGNRFWPWQVLDRVHPPRHSACPCRLRSYGWAIAEGRLRPGDVLDTVSAIRAASGVVMEAAVAEGLVLRELLVGAGMVTPEDFDRVMS